MKASICQQAMVVVCGVSLMTPVFAAEKSGPPAVDESKLCVQCHRTQSAALVMEWERSRHAANGIGCLDCHRSKAGAPTAWQHSGVWISTIVTPKDCSQCHDAEYQQFSRSHHARAGEILASLDNVLAEKAAGMPGNIADAVNGCWQCHGTIVKLQRDASGNVRRSPGNNKPLLDPTTWPNSGIGRLNPDGSKGSCHACHSRHSFEAKLARAPENCGKCHMGPDHPHIEIYNESKHGIAFHANRDKMALDKVEWVLGKDYSAAPTCATCHVSSYMTPKGKTVANSHDVGERISWTLRPVVSTKLNLVTFEDGSKEDYPDTKPLPKVGDVVTTSEKVVEHEAMVSKPVQRRVAKITMWQERRDAMKGVCLNCHASSHVDNFYQQFDDLVALYNDKFAKPAQQLMNDLAADGALNPKAPFDHELQWIFYELWHHEGRRARHGASMMGPDYTHWHGMYEVAKHFYTEFLPKVVETAAAKSPALKTKYEQKVQALLAGDAHRWKKGMTAEEAEAIRKEYQNRYGK